MFQNPQIHSFKFVFDVSKIKINAHTFIGYYCSNVPKKIVFEAEKNNEQKFTLYVIHPVCDIIYSKIVCNSTIRICNSFCIPNICKITCYVAIVSVATPKITHIYIYTFALADNRDKCAAKVIQWNVTHQLQSDIKSANRYLKTCIYQQCFKIKSSKLLINRNWHEFK